MAKKRYGELVVLERDTGKYLRTIQEVRLDGKGASRLRGKEGEDAKFTSEVPEAALVLRHSRGQSEVKVIRQNGRYYLRNRNR